MAKKFIEVEGLKEALQFNEDTQKFELRDDVECADNNSILFIKTKYSDNTLDFKGNQLYIWTHGHLLNGNNIGPSRGYISDDMDNNTTFILGQATLGQVLLGQN